MNEPPRIEKVPTGGLVLGGDWTLDSLHAAPAFMHAQELPAHDKAALHLAAMGEMDSAGALLILQLAERYGLELQGARAETQALLALMAHAPALAQPHMHTHKSVSDYVALFGHSVETSFATFRAMLAFLGLVLEEGFALLRGKAPMRWDALFMQMEYVGIRALAIVGLMNFLVGLMVAQQGALQLSAYSPLYTIDLIGRLTMRELGVLLTSVLIAGRSGSAFAAEIGTMKLNEEVDALRTMGLSPVQLLVLPRMGASIIMLPLLAFYATVIAIFAGAMFCWVMLKIPPTLFVSHLHDVLPVRDIGVAMIKAPIFGLIIGLAGCHQGMMVAQDAEQLGKRTTEAVVLGIFLVIVLDALFAVFFSAIGFG
jgi:phospholipid/cholesterol/gamma-HCH transport system permease protein